MNKYRPLTPSTSCLRSALYRPQSHVLIASPPRKHQAHPSVPRSQRRYLNTQHQAVRFTTGLNNLQTATGVVLFALGGFYYYYHNASMSGKLIPSNPSDVMVIRDITPNVVTLSVPFSRFGRLHVGGRGTLGRPRRPHLAHVSFMHVSFWLTPNSAPHIRQNRRCLAGGTDSRGQSQSGPAGRCRRLHYRARL